WQAYWRTWRHSTRLNVLRLLLFSWVFFVGRSQMNESWTPAWRVGGALLCVVLTMLLLAIYPIVRFKSAERTLTISPSGMETTIGKLSGNIPWKKVGAIEPSGRCIYIFGLNGNSFAVPHRAFLSVEQRSEFLRRANQWWNEARRV